jgi:hypothetical protein
MIPGRTMSIKEKKRTHRYVMALLSFQEFLRLREGLWLSDKKTVEWSKLTPPQPKRPPRPQAIRVSRIMPSPRPSLPFPLR